MACIAGRHPGAWSIAVAAAVGCVGLLPMLFFDNVLEQPHIMGPLAILVIAARGVRSGLREGAAASASAPVGFESLANPLDPNSSPSRSRF